MLEEIDDQQFLILGFDQARMANPQKTLERLRQTFPEAQVQLVKADLIAGREHLLFAARNALQAFKGRNRRAKSLAVELLLYISCQRQISKAISVLGVGPGDQRVIILGLSGSRSVLEELSKKAQALVNGQPADDLVEINSEKKASELKKVYHITPREFNASRFPHERDTEVLKRLVIERSALLALKS